MHTSITIIIITTNAIGGVVNSNYKVAHNRIKKEVKLYVYTYINMYKYIG